MFISSRAGISVLILMTLITLVSSAESVQQGELSTTLGAVEKSTTDNWNTTWLGSYANGPGNVVVVEGNFAYFGKGNYLQIIDLSDPVAPVELGKAFFSDEVQDIIVRDGIAYVAAMFAGVRIIDVSFPEFPVEIGFLDLDINVVEIAIRDNILFSTEWFPTYGTRMIDVSDPTMPFEVKFLSEQYPNMVFSGDLAFCSAGYGLSIWTISGKGIPQTQIGFVETPNALQDLVINGNIAYLATEESGLRVIDVSNPHSPVESGYFVTPGAAQGVAVSGDFAYVADYEGGLRIINVADPVHPAEWSYFEPVTYSLGVAVCGNHVCVVDMYGQLQIVDVSDPSNPQEGALAGRYINYANNVHVRGDTAFYEHVRSVDIVDMNNPMIPVLLGTYSNEYIEIQDFAVGDNLVYLANGGTGLLVIDVENPAVPLERGAFGFPEFPYPVYDVELSGDFALVTTGTGLRIIDVSNPDALVEVGFFDTAEAAFYLDISGNHAYVAAEACLYIIDVSNPAAPVEMGQYNLLEGIISSVAVSGNVVGLGMASGGLSILDVSNPASPVNTGWWDTDGHTEDVELVGGLAYIADYGEGMRVIDISDIGAPTESAYFESSRAVGLDVIGNIVYVADYWHGLLAVSNDLLVSGIDDLVVSTPRIILHDSFPNPFNPQTTIAFDLPEAGVTYLHVFDLSGRLVRTLMNGQMARQGRNEVVWNGRDESGRWVSSGVYFYSLGTGKFSETKKMVLMK